MCASSYIKEKYDIGILRQDGSTKVGLMLRRDTKGVPIFATYDDEYLAAQYFTGEPGYGNLPPEKEMVLRQDDWRVGFGLEVYDANDPKRYFSSLGMDMRFRGKAIAGPIATAIADIPGNDVLPTGFVDTGAGWTSETAAYDDDTASGSTSGSVAGSGGQSQWLELSIASITCWGARAYLVRSAGSAAADTVEIDLYYSAGWHSIYNGAFNSAEWTAQGITTPQAVTAMRLQFTNNDAAAATYVIHEGHFNGKNGVIVDAINFNSVLYFAAGNSLVKLNATGDGLTMVKAFPTTITDLEVFSDSKLYIALGFTYPYWEMTTAAAFQVNGLTVNKFKYFAFVRTTADTMYGSDAVNKIRSTVNPANGGTQWSGQTTVDSTVYEIMQLFTSSGALYIRKQNRPYYLNSSGVVKDDLAPELESLSRSIASQNIIEWLGKLYIPWGDQSLLEEDSGTLTWRSPSDFATGLSDFNGKVFTISADDRYLYAILDNGAKIDVLSGRLEEIDGSIVWVWHPINETVLIGCQTCYISTVVQKRLWITSTSTTDSLYYIPLPLGYADVVNDTNRSFMSGGAIDVGSAATDRGNYLDATAYTYIDLANAAGYDGRITSIAAWVRTAMTGFRVGTFYVVSGTTYKCRDSATLGVVTAGSSQTFIQDSGGIPLSIAVKAGDFIGCYFATGELERDTTGGSGVLYYNGEAIDAGDSASYSTYADDAMSLYATGVRGAIMETPLLHGNFKSTTKAFPSLELTMGHTYNTGRYFTVKYKKLGDSVWTTIGNYTGSATSMTQSKFIPVDASSNNPKATMFKLQFTAVTDDATITPVLLSYHLKAILYPSQRDIIACKVYCSNEIQMKDGTIDKGSYDTIIATLDEARAATWPVTIYDINGDTKTVKLLALPSGVPRWIVVASEKGRVIEREYSLLMQVVALS